MPLVYMDQPGASEKINKAVADGLWHNLIIVVPGVHPVDSAVVGKRSRQPRQKPAVAHQEIFLGGWASVGFLEMPTNWSLVFDSSSFLAGCKIPRQKIKFFSNSNPL
jgi:hypothetical protein